jgi:hypothetical protein
MNLSSLISPDTVRSTVRMQPAYTTNRDRVAALAQDGLNALDTYQSLRPYLFWGSLLGAVLSGFAAWKRRGARWETWALYGASCATFSTVAFLTRPGAFGGAPADPDALPSTPENPGPGFMGWVDTRVQKYRREMGTNFADQVLNKVVNKPSVKPSWNAMDPLVKAVVL